MRLALTMYLHFFFTIHVNIVYGIPGIIEKQKERKEIFPHPPKIHKHRYTKLFTRQKRRTLDAQP